MDGDAHVRALTECFASYATALQADIAHATEVEDAECGALHRHLARSRYTARVLGSVPPPRRGQHRTHASQWQASTVNAVERGHGGKDAWGGLRWVVKRRLAAETEPAPTRMENGCTMAKGGDVPETKVAAPGAKVGDKMNCDDKGTCTKKLLQ